MEGTAGARNCAWGAGLGQTLASSWPDSRPTHSPVAGKGTAWRLVYAGTARPFPRVPALPFQIAPRWGRAHWVSPDHKRQASAHSGAPPTRIFLVPVPGLPF